MRLSGLTLVVAAVLSLTAVQAQGLTPLQPSSVNGVSQSMAVSVQTYTAPDGRVFVMVGPMMMELKSHSVRSPRFQLLVQKANGELVNEAPGAVRTYRGKILGITGAKVAGSLLHDGFHARIVTKAGESYWVQPDRDPNAVRGQHLLYRGDDTVMRRKNCGTGLLPNAQIGKRNLPVGNTTEAALDVAELACDADFEYYTDYDSDIAKVKNRIESVINTMNMQYESEVNITHDIVNTTIRTDSKIQPYTSTDAFTLLKQFRDEWNANPAKRDIAHLFTGKSIDGGTIGIAWIGVVCHPTHGYGLVESDFNNNDACATDLSAHELGHNWNARHCGCRRNTMNSFITCANSFHAKRTRPVIAAFRDSLGCLGGQTGNPVTSQVSVRTTTPGASRGSRRARAVVTVTDNLGNAISGAEIVGQFTAGIVEDEVTGTTLGDGTVTFETNGTIKGKFTATFCVTKVSTALPLSHSLAVCDSN